MKLILSLLIGVLLQSVELPAQNGVELKQAEPRPVDVQKAEISVQDFKDILNSGFTTALIGLLGVWLGYRWNSSRDKTVREQERAISEERRFDEERQRLARELSAIKARADGKVHGLIVSAQNLNWYWIRTKYMISSREGNDEWVAKHFLEMEKYNLLISEFISIVSEFGGLSNTDKDLKPLVSALREYKCEFTPDFSGVNKKSDAPPLINAHLKTTFQDEIVDRMIDLMEVQINKLRIVPFESRDPEVQL